MVDAFVTVAHGDLRTESLAAIFLKALPRVKRVLAELKPPFLARVWRDGKTAGYRFA